MGKSFAELTENDSNRVMIVDALNLSFRYKHSGAKQFAEDYKRTVASLARSYNCGKIIIAADWGSSSYRKSILPTYKGNREALRANQTEKEKQDFEDFIKEYENTLNQLPWLVLRYPKVEADDIAAYICKCMHTYGIDHIWNISSDRDWDLMCSPHVSRFSYVTRKEQTWENWEYKFSPDMYVTYKCLVGDSGDNVGGVQGIGPKRATSIISEYGDIWDILDAIPIPGKAKYIQNLNASYELLHTNVELMDLIEYCEEAIGRENVSDLEFKVTEYLNE